MPAVHLLRLIGETTLESEESGGDRIDTVAAFWLLIESLLPIVASDSTEETRC